MRKRSAIVSIDLEGQSPSAEGACRQNAYWLSGPKKPIKVDAPDADSEKCRMLQSLLRNATDPTALRIKLQDVGGDQ